MKQTSTISNALIWFGAGVSIAEILTGTLIAPLGFKSGMAAIVLGHIIGCVLLFFAGLIGGKTRKSAMDTAKLSFGESGSVVFSFLNVLQLVGWTAVMIVSGAVSANLIISMGEKIWCIIIGALILLWIIIGVKNLGKINTVVMGALFILTMIMCFTIFGGEAKAVSDDGMTFGAAVELSVAMPLSWLPLISDYTRSAKRPFVASMASSLTYFVVSVWMYAIGMGAAIFTGETDIALIMLKAGLGVVALAIVILSTVTTTFLDVYSAGVSAESINIYLKEKPVAIVVCIIGTLLAVFTPITQFEGFLYFIGSVFAPMIAVLVTDYFILKRDGSNMKFDYVNIAVWFVGFVIYRIFMNTETVVGYTLPSMIITGIICLAVNLKRR